MLNSDYHSATVTFSMLGKLFISVTFSCIYVYSSELFPTEVRSIGVGTASMCARISSMAAAYVGGPLVSLSPYSQLCTTGVQLGLADFPRRNTGDCCPSMGPSPVRPMCQFRACCHPDTNSTHAVNTAEILIGTHTHTRLTAIFPGLPR